MKRLGGPRAAITIAVLACGLSAQAHSEMPQCLLGPGTVGARLVCDEDGCVRQRQEADCSLTQAVVVRIRQQSPIRKRIVRDDVGILLARLD